MGSVRRYVKGKSRSILSAHKHLLADSMGDSELIKDVGILGSAIRDGEAGSINILPNTLHHHIWRIVLVSPIATKAACRERTLENLVDIGRPRLFERHKNNCEVILHSKCLLSEVSWLDYHVHLGNKRSE